MRADERIIEYDVGDVDPLGRKIAIVLTNRAVYFLSSPDAVRVPYENIGEVRGGAGGRWVGFSTARNLFSIQITGSPKGDLHDTISHHLGLFMAHRQTIQVPGGSVVAMCRSTEEGGPLRWLVQVAEGVDTQDDTVRETLRVALAEDAERLGIDLPPWIRSDVLLAARGRLLPHTIVEADQGGPGYLTAVDDELVFQADSGPRHTYPWDFLEHYAATGDQEIVLKTQDFALVTFECEEPERWADLFTSKGIPEASKTD